MAFYFCSILLNWVGYAMVAINFTLFLYIMNTFGITDSVQWLGSVQDDGGIV